MTLLKLVERPQRWVRIWFFFQFQDLFISYFVLSVFLLDSVYLAFRNRFHLFPIVELLNFKQFVFLLLIFKVFIEIGLDYFQQGLGVLSCIGGWITFLEGLEVEGVDLDDVRLVAVGVVIHALVQSTFLSIYSYLSIMLVCNSILLFVLLVFPHHLFNFPQLLHLLTLLLSRFNQFY